MENIQNDMRILWDNGNTINSVQETSGESLSTKWKKFLDIADKNHKFKNIQTLYTKAKLKCMTSEAIFQSWLRTQLQSYTRGTTDLVEKRLSQQTGELKEICENWFTTTDNNENAMLADNANRLVVNYTDNKVIQYQQKMSAAIHKENYQNPKDTIRFVFDHNLQDVLQNIKKINDNYKAKFTTFENNCIVLNSKEDAVSYAQYVQKTRVLLQQLSVVVNFLDDSVNQSYMQKWSLKDESPVQKKSGWVDVGTSEISVLNDISNTVNPNRNFETRTNYLYMEAWNRSKSDLKKLAVQSLAEPEVTVTAKIIIPSLYSQWATVSNSLDIQDDTVMTTVNDLNLRYMQCINRMNGENGVKKALLLLLNDVWLSNRLSTSDSQVLLVENVDVECITPNLIKRIEPVIIFLSTIEAANSDNSQNAWVSPKMQTFDLLSLAAAMMSLGEDDHISIYSTTL